MADILALQIYIKSNLIPAVVRRSTCSMKEYWWNFHFQLETFWLDETYRVSMINVYGQPLGGFPLAFLFGKRRREEIRDKITTIYGDPENDENKKLVNKRSEKMKERKEIDDFSLTDSWKRQKSCGSFKRITWKQTIFVWRQVNIFFVDDRFDDFLFKDRRASMLWRSVI